MPRFNASTEIDGSLIVPPSKSYTHRALVAAALADGESKIVNPLTSEDTCATIRALRAMGVSMKGDERGDVIMVRPPEVLEPPDDVIDCGGSGTTMRLMISVASLARDGYTILTGGRRLRERPNGPLLDSLSQLGVEVFSSRLDGRPPIVIRGGGIEGGEAVLDASISSQFVSSILLVAPRSRRGVKLRVDGAVSKPYIDATIDVMEKFGVDVSRSGYEMFNVDPGRYRHTEFVVPGDFSSASFFIVLVAMRGGNLELKGLEGMPQPDSTILEIVEEMGADVKRRDCSVIIKSDGDLHGGRFSLRDSPDLLPVLAVMALKADGPVEILGVEHTMFKESDRLNVLAEEMGRIGGIVECGPGSLKIYPLREPRPAIVRVHGDHRVYMAFAVASAVYGGAFSVEGSTVYRKSYPEFIHDLERLGVDVY